MGDERRTEPRLSVNEECIVKVIGDCIGECVAQILDYSKSGLSLILNSSVLLASGDEIEVHRLGTHSSTSLTIAWSSISGQQLILGGYCLSDRI